METGSNTDQQSMKMNSKFKTGRNSIWNTYNIMIQIEDVENAMKMNSKSVEN